MPETSSAGLFYCFYFHNDTAKNLLTEEHCYKEEQECIPVGCVPPMAVAVHGGGSASVHAGIHPPGVGLETPPPVWAWRPPWPDPSTSPPPGCGPEDPLETCCKACWDTTCKTCWDTIPRRPAARHAGIPPPLWTDRHM